MATGETLSINPDQFHGFLKEYDDQFRPDEYGRPRAHHDKVVPRMGDWLEKVLGIFPGVELPKDRSILRNIELVKFDGYSPVVEFYLRIGKSKDVDYIKGSIRVPHTNDPKSGVALSLERSCKDERITGEFNFTKDGVMTGGSLISHL